MSAELTPRLHAAAETAGPGATRAEVAQAVCQELAAWLDEEATLYTAKLTSSRRGIRKPSPGDRAHRDVIDQLADAFAPGRGREDAILSGPRLTTPTVSVLDTLLTAPGPTWGLDICRTAGLGSGTVYPILARLRDRGWVTSWSEAGAHPGRPGRVYYELTDAGRTQARAALEARTARIRRCGLH